MNSSASKVHNFALHIIICRGGNRYYVRNSERGGNLGDFGFISSGKLAKIPKLFVFWKLISSP
jgi:hypothetical protein